MTRYSIRKHSASVLTEPSVISRWVMRSAVGDASSIAAMALRDTSVFCLFSRE